MKKPFLLRKAWVLLFALLALSHAGLRAQVCLTYAADTSTIVRISQNGGVIDGKRIMSGSSYGIQLISCSNMIIRNCIIGPTAYIGLSMWSCTNITIENCIFFDNPSSIKAEASSGIKVNGNQFMNAQNPPAGYGSFVQFSDNSGSGAEIKNNVGENIAGNSVAEDMINIMNSYFSALSPLVISGNKLRGGTSVSGGGINVGDDYNSGLQNTGNVIVTNNKLVDPGQYGIAISGGSNITFDGNQIYARHQIFTNVGIGIWDFYGRSGCANNTVINNDVNYTGNTSFLSNIPYYNPFWTDNSCGTNYPNRATDNNLTASIDETILPERLLCPFPVAYLKFESNLNDYCGSGLNATAYGTAAVVCDDYRKAAWFNGTSSDVMTLPKSPWLKPSTQMITVSAWIKPDAVSNIQGFVRSQDADGWSDGWRCILNNSDFRPSVMTDNGRAEVVCGGITANAWNHVVFTYDGKKMKGYVNGVLIATDNTPGNIIYTGSANLAIGGSEGTTNFGGKIAEVKILYGAMSDSEVAADYNSSKDMFDGAALAAALNIQAEYNNNGQSKFLAATDFILANQSGYISGTSTTGSTYLWQVLSGSPTYFSSIGPTAFLSIPDGNSVNLRLTAYTGACSWASYRDYTIYANMFEPFSIKLLPGKNEVLVSKVAQEGNMFNNGSGLLPGGLNRSLFDKGPYTVQVINLLGQVIKTGTLTNGQLTLNINHAITGVYIVRVMRKSQTVYTTKVFKP